MSNLFWAILIGSILLRISLHLEAQTTYRGSAAYNKLKYIGGAGAIMAWLGLCILVMTNR